MTDSPFISIVMCIYNGDSTLVDAIESLLNQDYPKNRFEIILLNDGSVNDSEDFCIRLINSRKSILPRVTYAWQENRGLGSARNSGISISQGDIIAFIDQDATAEPNWISELSAVFRISQEVGVVGGKINILNKNKPFPLFIHWAHYYMEYYNRSERIPIVGTNMAFKKEVFGRQFGFYENFKSSGDETSFINIDILPKYLSAVSKTAIVYHERPWSLRQWLKERYRNGHEYALERKLSSGGKDKIVYIFYRSNSLFIPFFLMLAIMTKSLIAFILLVLPIMMLGYRCFVRDNIFIRLRILKREYGVLKLPMSFLVYAILNVIGKIIDDYGLVRGTIHYSRARKRNTISNSNIKRIITNMISESSWETDSLGEKNRT